MYKRGETRDNFWRPRSHFGLNVNNLVIPEGH